MGTSTAAFIPGINVEVSATIDEPFALGLAIADLPADQQARVLGGLASGFRGFGGPVERGAQMIDIGRALGSLPYDEGSEVRPFLLDLAAHISEALSAAAVTR